MSSAAAGVRHRGKDKKRPTTPNPETVSEKVSTVVEKAKREFAPQHPGKEWDYKIAITIITILAFITRFWGISHPAQVVFDEVHFGKVRPAHISLRINCIGELRRRLTSKAVCFLLPPTHVLLRRPPSVRKASLRARRLARWIRWRLLV